MALLLCVILSTAGCTSMKPRARDSLPPPASVVHPVFDADNAAAGTSGVEPPGPLAIRDVRPEGPSDGAGIRLRLDRAVVDPAHPPEGVELVLERIDAAGTHHSIESRSRWSRPDTLVVVPLEDLPEATAFEVRLVGRIGDAKRGYIERTTWQFETPRPSLARHETWEDLHGSTPIWIVPSADVTPRELASRLRVHGKGGRDVAVAVRLATADEIDDRGFGSNVLAITPRRAWPAGERIDLVVDGALVGAAGPLAMGTPWRDHLDVRPAFAIGKPRCDGVVDGVCPLGPIRIATSTAIDEGSLERIRVEPAVDGVLVRSAYDDEGGIEIDAEWREGQRYRIVFDRRIRDEHGRTLGRTQRVPVTIGDRLGPDVAMIGLSAADGIFLSPQAAKIAVRTRRVTAFDVRVTTLRASDVPTLVGVAGLGKLPRTDRVVVARHEPAGSRWNERVTIDLGRDAAVGDVVVVEATARGYAPSSTPPRDQTVRGVFRISALGVVAHRGPRHGFVRVTSTVDGSPVPGAAVELHSGGKSRARHTTDRSGLAWIAGAGDETAPPSVLVSRGDDAVAMQLGWQPALDHADRRAAKVTSAGTLAEQPRHAAKAKPRGVLRAGELAAVDLFTGRAVYLPGDPVHIAGWGGISTPHDAIASRRVPAGTKVVLSLMRGNDEIAKRTVRIDEHGRFHATIRTPVAAPLGAWTVRAAMLDASADSRIVVAETRIPTFEVDLDAGPDEILLGTEIEATASARYLSGEAATIGAAQSTMWCHTSRPPGMAELPDDFRVDSDVRIDAEYARRDPEIAGASATSRFATRELDPRSPWSCALAVAVADRGLQEEGADDQVFVHPADIYLALRDASPIGGRRHVVEAIAVDRRGRRVALSGVEITVDRGEGRTDAPTEARTGRNGRCRVDIAADGPAARCRSAVLREGTHRVRARAMLDERLVYLERELWIAAPPVPSTAPEPPPPPVITSTPPREQPFEIHVAQQLAAGEPGTVEIVGPWPSASGVLAVEQIGIRKAIPFELVRGRATVEVEPSTNLGPSIELVARVARGSEDGALPKEHATTAAAAVLRNRTLDVAIDAPVRAAIRERVPIRITVTGDRGAPVDARIAVWVVDEGLFRLRETYGPGLVGFDRDRRAERSVSRTYDALIEPFAGFRGRGVRAPSIRMAQASVSGALDGSTLRQRFDPAPLFVGNVGTGPDGVAVVDLQLPDDLTRFRIHAVASAALDGHPESGPARFGSAKRTITTSTPLVVRGALPRTLRPGDETTVAALVSVPRDGEVDVVLEIVDDHLRSRGVLRKRVAGRRGQVARVAFDVRAHSVGDARVRLRATLHEKDGKRTRTGAVEQTVAIHRERTQTERVALHGSIDDDRVHALPVRLPRRALPSSGTLEIATTTSRLGDFSDAEAYLSDYPYGCIEQSASRLVPLVAIDALGNRSRDAERARTQANDVVAHILSMQRSDGSFAYWPSSNESAGFAGGYALWILQIGERQGIDVPSDALARARAALAKTVRSDDLPLATPTTADDWLTHVMILHALADAGEAKPTDFDTAFAQRNRMSVGARALLAMGLWRANALDSRVETLRRDLGSLVEQRAAVAHFVQPEGSSNGAWDSPARDDALGLMALMQIDADNAAIDALAAGLVARRERGRWRTTQENAFALLALADYAARRESTAPRHRVRAWIGPRAVLDAQVNDRDATRRAGAAPVDTSKETADVTLVRRGTGRVHWRVGVQWTEADPPARAQGLALRTRILDEHDAEVTRMVAGRRYRIEVQLATDTPQQHVAVEVPLPGGVEAIDRSLGHGIAARTASTYDSSELTRIELRSDRAVLFFDELDPGATVQQVAVLATAAGTYAMPGAVAEAMYEPETFARTRAARVTIAPQSP